MPLRPIIERFRSRPARTDLLIAAGFVLLVLVESALARTTEGQLVRLLAVVPAMVALAWRRLFPITVTVLVIAANFLTNPEGESSTLLSLVLVCFTVGYETGPPRSQVGLAVVLVSFLGTLAYEGLEPSDVAAAFVFLVGPWFVGATMRHRSQAAAEATQRLQQLEREQVLQAAAAAADERVRIARELHDIVSHSISVVTVQTQAVRRRLGPEHQREADDLAEVEATAREAMAELRRIFGVLRADGASADLSPQPGLADLDRLLGQVRATGLGVELELHGTPFQVRPGVDLAAYRIVQESVTNALRHAGATWVTVSIGYRPDALDVVVDDDGQGMGRRGHQGGHGLDGIRERAELYGGTLVVGPSPRGGVRVSARLPVRNTP